MKVWVLTVEDGNVCCPAMDLLGVFSSEEAANQFANEHHAKHEGKYGKWSRNRDDYSLNEWTVDKGDDDE